VVFWQVKESELGFLFSVKRTATDFDTESFKAQFVHHFSTLLNES